MREIFVDTGAWIAVADPRDKFYRAAAEIYPQHLKSYDHLVTTNLVMAETYSLAMYRVGYQTAIKLLKLIRGSSRILQVYTTPRLDEIAFEILEKYDDQAFSFVDAASFAVMQDRAISTAFAYDKHFRVMGFQLENR
ncbi:MAG: PIN domain-containing protein [Chloroflexota bacterium]